MIGEGRRRAINSRPQPGPASPDGRFRASPAEFVRTLLALLERDRRAVLESIRESELGNPDAGAFSITWLDGSGWPPHVLAIQKQSNGVVEQVLLAQKRRGLSARQARVLDLFAAGMRNKEIARLLVCSERPLRIT